MKGKSKYPLAASAECPTYAKYNLVLILDIARLISKSYCNSFAVVKAA